MPSSPPEQQPRQLLSVERPLRVACIGGGQLGRMMALEAPRLNLQLWFLDALGAACPAAAAVPHAQIVPGSLLDAAAIRKLVRDSRADVLTAEIEHINCEALEELEQENNASSSDAAVSVQPSGRVIRLIQDKYQQKRHFAAAGMAVPPFVVCRSVADVRRAAQQLGLPLMLKSRTGAYDGRGNAVLESLGEENDDTAIHEALRKLGIMSDQAQEEEGAELGLYAEGWIDFDCEIAVMVVRSSLHETTAGDDPAYATRSYPAVNAIQQDSICRVVLAPARHVGASVRAAAEQLAVEAIDSLPAGASGVFGVEMFVTRSGEVLLNEVAPRPHNTGHYTQDACVCSQFENHLRAVCGLPLGSTEMKVEAAAMVNVLGAPSGTLARHHPELQCGAVHVDGYRALVRESRMPQGAEDGTHQLDGPFARGTRPRLGQTARARRHSAGLAARKQQQLAKKEVNFSTGGCHYGIPERPSHHECRRRRVEKIQHSLRSRHCLGPPYSGQVDGLQSPGRQSRLSCIDCGGRGRGALARNGGRHDAVAGDWCSRQDVDFEWGGLLVQHCADASRCAGGHCGDWKCHERGSFGGAHLVHESTRAATANDGLPDGNERNGQ